jgi:hypothetical protein
VGGDIAGDLLSSFSRNAIRDTTNCPWLPGGNAPKVGHSAVFRAILKAAPVIATAKHQMSVGSG